MIRLSHLLDRRGNENGSCPPIRDGSLLAPSRQRRRVQCYIALAIGDSIAVVTGFALAGHFVLAGHLGGAKTSVVAALVDVLPVLLLSLTLALHNGSYGTKTLQEAWSGIARATTALLVALVLVVFARFLIVPRMAISPAALIGGTLFAMFMIVVIRLPMRRFVRWHCGVHVLNELLIDDGGPPLNFDGAIRMSAAAGGLRPDLNDPLALDRFGLAVRNIDRVIISCPISRRAAWAMMLKGANIDGEILVDGVAMLGARGARVVGNHGLLLVSAGPLDLRERMIKRLFDIAFAGSVILVLSPLLAAVALAVKLQDLGPILFIQRRMGRGNRFFNMYKFRSMSHALSA